MNAKVAVSALLALFLLSATLTDAVPLSLIGIELRCRCVSTHSEFINPTDIQDFEQIPSGPHCKDLEIIATLKNGSEVCLDPTADWVKEMIKAKAEATAQSQV